MIELPQLAGDSYHCDECSATIYRGAGVTYDEIWMLCRRTLCPFWRRGHPSDPGQVEKDRYFEANRRALKADKAARDAEPIPD